MCWEHWLFDHARAHQWARAYYLCWLILWAGALTLDVLQALVWYDGSVCALVPVLSGLMGMFHSMCRELRLDG
jgi:hypothetical protein